MSPILVLNPANIVNTDEVAEYLYGLGYTLIWSLNPEQERVVLEPNRRERIATALYAADISSPRYNGDFDEERLAKALKRADLLIKELDK